MTGFGIGRAANASASGGEIVVQIASVNHRQCRVGVKSELRELELDEAVRQRVQERLQRGSVTVQVSIGAAARESDPGWDLEALRASYRALKALADELGAPAPRLESVLRQQPRGAADEAAAWRAPLEEALEAALDACLGMRRAEGARLLSEFQDQHRELVELRRGLAVRAALRRDEYHLRLRARLAELVGEQVDEATLVRELAIYGERIDVSEELVRLDSHLAQLGELLVSSDAIGKRLDFLLQEVGRELNTTGAKANDGELQRLVIDAKSVLERMREQAANVV